MLVLCAALISTSIMPIAKLPAVPSLLSLPSEQCAALMGGEDGARHVWRLLRRGLDPVQQWADDAAQREQAARHRISDESQRRLALELQPLAELVTLSQTVVARDATRKLLLRLADGSEVESVLIPPLPSTEGKRAKNARAHTTLCISSQVGCRMACTFCATGRMGLVRSLSTDEILAQAWVARAVVEDADLPPLTSIVFMGSVLPPLDPLLVALLGPSPAFSLCSPGEVLRSRYATPQWASRRITWWPSSKPSIASP